MPQFLTLSRAARLIGVSRGALQKKIKDGELKCGDGMVSAEGLRAAYPSTKTEQDLLLEQITQIKDEAFGKRVRERMLPAQDVLARRLYEQSRELTDVKTHLQRYHSLLGRVQERLRELGKNGGGELRTAMAAVDDWINGQLGEVLDTEAPDPLSVMDDYLRLVSAQVTVRPSRHEFFVDGVDTLLDAGLRAGLALNYGCNDGSCGLCKARIASGQTRKIRDHAYVLSETEKSMGHVLMCAHTPVSDLVIEALEATAPDDIPQQDILGRVKTLQALAEDVRLLQLEIPSGQRLRFLAGQSVTLGIGEATADYPVANCPCEERGLQFHIRNSAGNNFAWRVFNGLASGDAVAVRGPRGNFVLRRDSRRPLLFLAGDSGLAPIKSLVENAMAMDKPESMQLYWVMDTHRGHYLQNLCRSWMDALDNFRYTPLFAANAATGGWEPLFRTVARDHSGDLDQFDVYLAGCERFVAAARKWLLGYGLPETQLISTVA